MKKIVFLSFAALCFAATTQAQSTDTASHRRMDRGEMMKRQEERQAKELSLTDDQKTQFQTIDKAQWSSMDSLRQAGGSRDGMMSIMKNSNDQKRALLTPDQQTKWDAMMKERQDRMRNRQNGGSGGN